VGLVLPLQFLGLRQITLEVAAAEVLAVLQLLE
jgi:hypothetical protein